MLGGRIGRPEYASLDLWNSGQESVFLCLVKGRGIDGPEVER